MKKIMFFLLLFTLSNNYFLFSQSQTVTIDRISVNNASVSNGLPINLGSKSSSTISFDCTVKLSSAPSNNNPGQGKRL